MIRKIKQKIKNIKNLDRKAHKKIIIQENKFQGFKYFNLQTNKKI